MKLSFILLALFGNILIAQATFDTTLRKNAEKAYTYLLQNISPVDSAKGFVVASPSKTDPDYYYHWVRDAALTMQALEIVAKPADYLPLFNDYVTLESKHQKINKLTDQGEPKFNLDGTAFSGPWGRPQNDGPALRALTLIKQANLFISQNKMDEALKLYSPVLPAQTPIKIDLEYISHQWKELNFDLWEEVKGHHFYTRAVQAYALTEGAKLAKRLDDIAASRWYQQQAIELYAAMEKHWSAKDQIYFATLNPVATKKGRNKESNLDSAVILSVLHTNNKTSRFGILDNKIVSTFNALERKFQSLYPINKAVTPPRGWPEPGTAIGRYPEDVYFGGHPWFLITSGFAEFCYRYSLAAKNDVSIKYWMNKGDEFLARTLLHIDANGHQAEQFHKETGVQLSARDLTWSYAAYLTAYQWRETALKNKRRVSAFQNSRL